MDLLSATLSHSTISETSSVETFTCVIFFRSWINVARFPEDFLFELIEYDIDEKQMKYMTYIQSEVSDFFKLFVGLLDCMTVINWLALTNHVFFLVECL